VAALTAGVFAWGMHLGPGRPPGHNLLKATIAAGPRPVTGIMLASLKQRMAQAGGPDARDQGDASDSDSPGAIFQDVYSLLRRNYVDPLPDDTHLAHGAAAAMLASLGDPESRFLEPADMAELTGEAKGQYHGLGAVTAVRKFVHPKQGDAPSYTEFRLTVVAPLPGSPAEKAGLRPGDYVTDINGQWIAAYDPALAAYKSLDAAKNDPVAFNKLAAQIEKKEADALALTQAESKLTDGSQKSLTLTVVRPGAPQPLKVTADDSAPTTVTPVTGKMLPAGVGYIKIAQFTDGADKQFDSVLSSLDTGLKGLVLDLRDCPGGLRDVGAAIASRLTTAATLGILETKGKKQTPLTLSPHKQVACPIVVLVNAGTANTAELVAATLQASGSKLVGVSTFGDAGDVKPIALRDGSGFTMTVGKLLTSQGREFADVGIKPDLVVLDAPGGDAPLTRAIGALSGQVARR